MKKHISALIFLFILHSVPTALAQGTPQLSPRAQANETLQTFLASVQTNMTLQDFIYPDGALIDEKRRLPSDDEIYDYYTYDLGGCLVTVSAFNGFVKKITVPAKDNACVFDIAPFAEIPVNNAVLTSSLNLRAVREHLTDSSHRNYYLPVEQKNEQFEFESFWHRDFVGVTVRAIYETKTDSEIGQRYIQYRNELEADEMRRSEIRESIFNLVADEEITAVTIYTVGERCGLGLGGMYRQREDYYRTHGIDLKD